MPRPGRSAHPDRLERLVVGEAVVALIRDYQRLFLEARPADGDDTIYKAFFVVFTDLSADRAKGLLGDALDQLAVPSYTRDGFVMGPFYEGSAGTALYNANFHPFTSPVPSVLVRQAVVRLEVLPGQRGTLPAVGTSLRRVGSPGARRRSAPPALAHRA